MYAERWVNSNRCHPSSCIVKRTVYRWRERKGLPAHKIGRLWKFQLSEVDGWVRAGDAGDDSESESEQS
jgi:excisionase family DNA binding protein